MKFFFEGTFDVSPRENGKLATVSTYPDSNSRSRRPVFVLVAKEIQEVISGGDYSLGMVGENKTPMLFPNPKPDSRILVMGNVPQPGHRSDGFLNISECTGKLIDESCGGGAWGSGSCFLAILEDGQRMVSNRLIVWENKGGELFKTKFGSLSEYELAYKSPDIEFV